MPRYAERLAAMLILASAAPASAQGVPRPASSRIWYAPARVGADSTRTTSEASMVEAGALFGGLMGVAFGIGWCSGDNQCNKGTSALIGGAMGAAIGAGLGSLLASI